MYRPNRVRPSRKLQATTTTRTTRTTHGTPRTAIATPRLVLPISTTTTPAIAIAATFSQVTLAGGVASPLVRRRLSRTTNSAPASATAAAMTIQPAAGLMAPPSMSDRTLLYSLMVPPEPGAATLMMYSRKPWANSNPASVTTKDGSRSRVTRTPWIAPKAAGKARPARTASGHGAGFGGTSSQQVNTAPITEV